MSCETRTNSIRKSWYFYLSYKIKHCDHKYKREIRERKLEHFLFRIWFGKEKLWETVGSPKCPVTDESGQLPGTCQQKWVVATCSVEVLILPPFHLLVHTGEGIGDRNWFTQQVYAYLLGSQSSFICTDKYAHDHSYEKSGFSPSQVQSQFLLGGDVFFCHSLPSDTEFLISSLHWEEWQMPHS